MSLSKTEIAKLGEKLYRSLRDLKTIDPLIQTVPEIDIRDAYEISREMLKLRLANDNEKVTGKKIGVTSDAVQKMLGVYQPDFGFLTDAMEYPNNSDIPVGGNLIQPRAEAEIAFRLKSDLKGPGVTEQDVLAATDVIMPCFEIVDSRITNWKIAIQDTVADNASCGVYVLGDAEIDPNGIDLADLKIQVFKNGEPLSEGMGSAVQGNPLTAVAWLANTLGELGIPFLAGEIILSGSLVPLEPVNEGDSMELQMGGQGIAPCSVACRFTS